MGSSPCVEHLAKKLRWEDKPKNFEGVRHGGAKCCAETIRLDESVLWPLPEEFVS